MAKNCNYLTAFSHWPVAFKNPCPQKQVLPVQYPAIFFSHLQMNCMEKSFNPNGDLQTHEVWITQVYQTLKTTWVDTTSCFVILNEIYSGQWQILIQGSVLTEQNNTTLCTLPLGLTSISGFATVSDCCIIEPFIIFLPPYCSLLV